MTPRMGSTILKIIAICSALIISFGVSYPLLEYLYKGMDPSAQFGLLIAGIGFILFICSFAALFEARKARFRKEVEKESAGDVITSLNTANEDEENRTAFSFEDVEFTAETSLLLHSIDDARREAISLLSDVRGICDDTKALASKASTKILSDEFKRYSFTERILSFSYDAIAITVSVMGLCILVWTLSGTNGDPTSVTIMKLAVTVGTFTVSGFIFRRGTFHHREAKAAKRTELALSQYQPFIATLPRNKRDDIIADIARRVFINGDMDHSEERLVDIIGHKGVDLPSLVELLKLLNGKDA